MPPPGVPHVPVLRFTVEGDLPGFPRGWDSLPLDLGEMNVAAGRGTARGTVRGLITDIEVRHDPILECYTFKAKGYLYPTLNPADFLPPAPIPPS